VKFASDLVPDRITRIKDSSSLQKYLDKNPEQPHVILFSAKPDVSSLFKSFAVKYGSRILFGQAKQGIKEAEDKYNIKSFPTVISVTGENVVTFDGSIGSEQLNAWLAGLVGEEADTGSSPPGEEAKPKAQPKPKVEATFAEATSDTLSELCTSPLCVVGFVDVTTDGGRAVAPEHNAVLKYVLEKWHKDVKYKFVWVDRAAATDLVQKFSVSSGGPSLIVYNAKRAKFAKAEKFDESSAHVLLEHVNAGDAKYQQCKSN